LNGDRTDSSGIEYQKKDKENGNTDCDKTQIYKYPSAEGEQHTVKNKLKEDLQIMWQKVGLLQISEREKMPRLKKKSKLIKFQEEINGVIQELLKKPDIRCSHNYDTNIE